MAVPTILRTANLTDANFSGDSSYRAMPTTTSTSGTRLEQSLKKSFQPMNVKGVFINNGSGFMFKAINSGNDSV